MPGAPVSAAAENSKASQADCHSNWLSRYFFAEALSGNTCIGFTCYRNFKKSDWETTRSRMASEGNCIATVSTVTCTVESSYGYSSTWPPSSSQCTCKRGESHYWLIQLCTVIYKENILSDLKTMRCFMYVLQWLLPDCWLVVISVWELFNCFYCV